MTLYIFTPLAFVLLEHEHARLPVLQHAEKLQLLLHPAHVLPRLLTRLLLEQLLMRKRLTIECGKRSLADTQGGGQDE